MFLQINKKQAYECYKNNVYVFGVPNYMDYTNIWIAESGMCNIYRNDDDEEKVKNAWNVRCAQIMKNSYGMMYGNNPYARYLKFYIEIK